MTDIEKNCDNCKHTDVNGIDEPCVDCDAYGASVPEKWEPQEAVAPADEPALVAEIVRRALAGELSPAALDVLCALFSGEDEEGEEP